MKRLFIVLSVLFFSFLVFAEDVTCENEAGNCTLSVNEYSCNCQLLNGAGIARGDVSGEEVTEELCKSYLESNCGKEKPTVRSKCGKKFDFCVTYVSENSRCTDDYMSEDDVIAAVDSEDAWNETKQAVYYGCCGKYRAAQGILECLKEKCGDDFANECCAECNIDDPEGDTDVSDTGADIADTEETTGEDSADGESKEESKSDGCSMLFV